MNNKPIFNVPQSDGNMPSPIFEIPHIKDDFEKVGQAVLCTTTWITPALQNNVIVNLDVVNNNFYILMQTRAYPHVYTLYRTTFNSNCLGTAVTLGSIPSVTRNGVTWTSSNAIQISVYNNELYVLWSWIQGNTVEKFNLTTGSYISRVLTFTEPNYLGEHLTVIDDLIFILGRRFNQFSIIYYYIFNLSDGSQVSRTLIDSLFNATTNSSLPDFAINSSRIYLAPDQESTENHIIRVYDRDYDPITSENIAYPTSLVETQDGTRLHLKDLIIDNDKLYIVNSTGRALTNTDNVLYYSGISYPYASFSSIQYNRSSNSITANLLLPESISTINAEQDFKIEKKGGNLWSPTWTEEVDSNWAITATGSGTKRTVTATGSASITDGIYRIVLKEDAFATDKPNTDILSKEVLINSTVVIFGTPTINNSNKEISWNLTFNDAGSGLTADDFTVSGTVPFTVSLSGSGNSRTVVIYNTENVIRTGSVSITINSSSFTDKKIIGNRISPSASYSFAANLASTTVSFNSAASREHKTIVCSVTFSNAGAGLTVDDFSISSASAFTISLTGSGNNWFVLLYNTDTSTSGNVTLTIASNAFSNRTISGARSSNITFNLNEHAQLQSVGNFIGNATLNCSQGTVTVNYRSNFYFRNIFPPDNNFVVDVAGPVIDYELSVSRLPSDDYSIVVTILDVKALNNQTMRIVALNDYIRNLIPGYINRNPAAGGASLVNFAYTSPAITASARVSVRFSLPKVDNNNRSISWDFIVNGSPPSTLNTNHFTPSGTIPFTVSLIRCGNNGTLTLTNTEFANRSGLINTTVSSTAFNSNPAVIGNRTSPTAYYTFSVDTTVSFLTPIVTNSNRRIAFIVAFSNPGNGLTAEDFTITSDPTTSFTALLSGSGNNQTLILVNTESVNRSGTVKITIASNAFTDRNITSSNRESSCATFNFSAPVSNTTVTFATPSINNRSRTISWNITFSNAGSGLTISDFEISGATTFTAALTGTGNSRTLTLTNSETTVARSGSVTITLNELAFTDRNITGGRISGAATYNFLVITPTTITYGTPTVDNTARTVTWVATFSDAGSGLTTDDFTISGSIAFLISITGTGNTRTITITNIEAAARTGSVTITISSTAFNNRNITSNRISGAATYNFAQRSSTTVTFATPSIDNNARTISWVLTFSNAGSGLTTSDFEISGATTFTAALTGTGNSRILTLTNSETTVAKSGSVTITLTPTAFTDRAISGNRVSTAATYDFLPQATISYSGASVDNNRRFLYWGIDITPDQYEHLTANDFTVSGTVPFSITFTGPPWHPSTSNRRIFLVNTETVSRSGSVNVTLNADAIPNYQISGNRTSSSISYSFPSSARATVNITYHSPVVDNNARTISWQVIFFGFGTGLTADDFTVSGTVPFTVSLSADDNPTTVTLTNTEGIARSGSVTITVAANAFTNLSIGGNRVSGAATYNFAEVPTTVTYGTPTVDNARKTISFGITFSNAGSGLTESDFAVSGTTTFNSTLSGTGNNRTLILKNTESTARSGSVTITISTNAFTDRAISGNRVSTAATYNFALTAIATWSNQRWDGRRMRASLTFTGAAIRGLALADLQVLNASNQVQNWVWTTLGSSTVADGSSINIVARPPTTPSGKFKFRLREFSVISGSASTNNTPIENVDSDEVRINLSAVGVTSFTAPATSQTGTTSVLRLTLNRSVPTSQITTSDFTAATYTSISSVAAVSPSSGNASIYDVTVNNPTNRTGTYTISLNANAVADGDDYDGGPSSAFTSGSVSYDTRSQVVAVSSFTAPTGTQTGTKANFTLVFDQAIPSSELSTADFTGTNGASVAANADIMPTSGSQTTYTIAVTQPTTREGTYTVTLAQNAISAGTTYLQGPITAYTSTAASGDTRRVATASWGTGSFCSTNNKLSAQLTFTGANVTGISTSDFEVINDSGIVQSWTFDTPSATATAGTAITISVTAPSITGGSFRLRLKANSVLSDGGTTANAPATAVTLGTAVAIETRPVLSVSSFTAPSGVQTGTGVRFILTFNRPVSSSELDTGDFTASNGGRISNVTRNENSNAQNLYSSYIVVVSTPSRSETTMTATLAQNAIPASSTHQAGPTTAYTSTAASVDTRVRVRSRWSSLSFTNGKFQATLTFVDFGGRSVNISGISASDFEVLNASSVVQTGWTFDTPSATATTGTGITIAASAPAQTNASFRLRIKTNSVISDGGTTSNAPGDYVANESALLAIDNRTFTIATVTWTGITGGTSLVGTIRFNGAAVSNIDNSDFEVLNASDVVQTGWTISVSSSTATSGGSITVTATGPTNTNGSFKLRIKATSVRSGGSPTDNAPASASATSAVSFDNRNELNVSSFTAPTGTQTGTKANLTLTFDRAIPASELTTADFTGTNGASVAADADISPSSGSQTTYTVAATQPSRREGTYTITLGRNAISATTTYKAGPATAYESTAVSADTRRIATAAWSSVSFTNGKLQGTLTFTGANITGISTSDFDILNASGQVQSWTFDTPSTTATAGTGIAIAATAPADTNDEFRIRLKEDSVLSDGGSTNNAPAANTDTDLIAVDNRVFTIATATWSRTIGGSGLTARLTFTGADITHLDNDDFEVLDDSDVVQTGWSISLDRTEIADGGHVEVRATPPANVTGNYKLRLKQNAVRSDGSPLENAPANSVEFQSSYAVANRHSGFTSPVRWTNMTGGHSLSGTLELRSTTVMGLVGNDDIEVLDADNSDMPETVGSDPGEWNITVGNLSIQGSYTRTIITATPPANTDGSYKLRIKARSIMTGGSMTNNAPGSSYRSSAVDVDNTDTTSGKSEYTLTIPLPQGKTGSIQVALKERSINVSGDASRVGPENQQYLGTVQFNTETVQGEWLYANWCVEGNQIDAAIQFNKAITGLAVYTSSNLNGDIQVVNNKRRSPKDGWTFSFSGHAGTGNAGTLPANTPLVVTVTPPANTSEIVYLVFNANTVTSGGETGPAENIYTEAIGVENRPGASQGIIPRVIAKDEPDYIVTGLNNTFLFDFNVEVQGLSEDDFCIDGPSGYTVENANIYFATTADPDVRPDAAGRSTPIVVADPDASPPVVGTRAKYFKVVVNAPDPVPAGKVTIYLVEGAVNNDFT